ncbi:MAG: hypothetical protein IPI35_11670 [Deltaproteobacteria bacterium]|nr:hypothetical protein [Deltaproteobacteria bacterium]
MTRQQLLDAIATQIADYRRGEIVAPTPAHIDRWIKQFDDDVQLPILAELHHVFERMYFNENRVTAFLSGIATNAKLTGADPESFWRGAQLLNIQRTGNSQSDILAKFDAVLKKQFGFGVDACVGSSGVYVYLDEAIFSGTKVRNDLMAWLQAAPSTLSVHVVTIAVHQGGEWHAGEKVRAEAKKLGKTLDLKFWRCKTLEDRKTYMADSDLLKPTSLPDDPGVAEYVEEIDDPEHPLVLRPGKKVGKNGVFSSHDGRALLEREFLKAGVRIRKMCPNLPATMRPLGYHYFVTLGYGALLVTHRNCPNNAPLVFWVSPPWYPLFQRKPNE